MEDNPEDCVMPWRIILRIVKLVDNPEDCEAMEDNPEDCEGGG